MLSDRDQQIFEELTSQIDGKEITRKVVEEQAQHTSLGIAAFVGGLIACLFTFAESPLTGFVFVCVSFWGLTVLERTSRTSVWGVRFRQRFEHHTDQMIANAKARNQLAKERWDENRRHHD